MSSDDFLSNHHAVPYAHILDSAAGAATDLVMADLEYDEAGRLIVLAKAIADTFGMVDDIDTTKPSDDAQRLAEMALRRALPETETVTP